MIVLVDSAEHFTAFAANDNLCEAVVAAVASFLAIGACLDHSPTYQFFLYSEEDVLWNDCFVVAFYIVLQNNAIVLDSGLIQEVCSVCLLKQGIADVFLVSKLDVAASEYKHKNYEDVAAALKTLGFTNIKYEVLYDIILGWTDDGEVDNELNRGSSFMVRLEVGMDAHISKPIEVAVLESTLRRVMNGNSSGEDTVG